MTRFVKRISRYRKIGGLHFLRFGRYQISFCRCRNA